MTEKQLNILGTRGVPAAHGGFETFAAVLAPYLVDRGWRVNVYCQDVDNHPDGSQDEWNGVTRTHFRSTRSSSVGTIQFDYKSIRHVLGQPGIDLVLGYNTAIFTVLQRLRGRRVVMNMDGVEWKRSKWGILPKVWFFLNELIGANLSQVLVADHPDIAGHISARTLRRPVMIPYGSERIEVADSEPVIAMGLEPGRYMISISRIEPENSILELVVAAAALPDGVRGVVLGKFDPNNAYHAEVLAAGRNRVMFPGAIYDPKIVSALRFHALAYLHGHQVGGTNPSLVEALGAGSAVLCHDNRFNRWTAGEGQFFFSDAVSAQAAMLQIIRNPDRVKSACAASRNRHHEAFEWDDILSQYTKLLTAQLDL